MIPAPSRHKHDPDREADCQIALEAAFHDLRRRAEAVGWSAEEVSRALLALATAHIRARLGRAARNWAIRRGERGPANA